MKKFVFILGFLSIFVVGVWLIAIPESLMVDLIEDSLGRDDIYLETEGFKKGLFYNFRAEKIFLKKKGAALHQTVRGTTGNSDNSLIILDNINAGINIMSLLRLGPELDFNCKMNSGMITGVVKLTGRGSLRINGDGIDIGGIPFLELIGISGDGNLSWSLRLNDGTGEVRFSVDDLRLKNTSVEGVFLPLDMFKNIKGAMAVDMETIEVKSFALEGNGVYARAKGSVRGGSLNLKLELMMDSSFESGYIFRTMLERYKVSPGYYVIPIKTSYRPI